MSKPTRLQEEVSGYYLNSKNNFSNNEESNSYLKSISDISSMRGLSHKTRTERIGNWMNYLSENNINLTNFEKSYVEGLLTTSENYISNNSKRIKNSEGVLQSINYLRDKLDYSALRDFNSQIINEPVALEYQPTPSSKISLEEKSAEKPNYQIKQSSGWKKAGQIAKNTLITLGVGAVFTVGAYFVGNNNNTENKSQKATIAQQQEKILYQEGTIDLRDQKITENLETIAKDQEKISELQNLVEMDNKIIEDYNGASNSTYNHLDNSDANFVGAQNYVQVKPCPDKPVEKKAGYLAGTGKFVGAVFGGLFKSKAEKQEAKEKKNLENRAREERNSRKIKRLVNDPRYKFNDYGKYLGQKGKEYWEEKKHFESILTGVGSWCSLINEIEGNATKPVFEIVGATSRTIKMKRGIEKLLSFLGIKKPYQDTLKKDDPNENHWEKGKKDARETNDFIWRNLGIIVPLTGSGPNWNDSHAKAANWITGGFLGKPEEERGILKFNNHNPYSTDPNSTDPYKIEDGLPGAIIQIGSDVVPYVISNGGGGGDGGGNGITGGKGGGAGGTGVKGGGAGGVSP